MEPTKARNEMITRGRSRLFTTMAEAKAYNPPEGATIEAIVERYYRSGKTYYFVKYVFTGEK